VLIISHNLNDVFEVADRVAVLYLGRLVAQGPIAEFDRERVVDFITSGSSTRPPPSSTSTTTESQGAPT
jgi:ABC-type sugar transport system ATPase subunit